jgi:hypothetical protein
MIASFMLGFLLGFGVAAALVVAYLVYRYFQEDADVYRFNQR